jgi:exopolysaccharide production protein ExoQ
MPPIIASLSFAILIFGLFWIDRDRELRTSKALWIPTIWVLINASRPASMWLATFGFDVGPQTTSVDIYTEGSPIDRAVFTALVSAGLIVLIARHRKVGPLLRRNCPILLLFGFAALSIFWSDFPFVTFKRWTKGIGDVEMVFIVLTDADALGATKRLLSRVGLLLVPLSVLYCKYYPAIGRLMTRSWANTYVGVTTQKNTLGWLCLLLGLGFLWRIRAVFRDRKDSKRSLRILAYGLILGMILWLLQMSDSMTSFSSFIVVGTVMILASQPKLLRKRVAVHVLVAAAIGIPLFALFFDLSGSLVADLGRDPTLTGRTAIWSDVLRMPFNRLVGAGYESFWLGDRLLWLRAMAGFDVNEAHNGYLEIFLNLGWMGVGLLTVVIVTGYRKVIAALRASSDAGSLYLACFLAVLLASLTEAGFRTMSLTWIFFLFSIVAASKTPVPEILPEVAEDHTQSFAEYESEVDQMFRPVLSRRSSETLR